MDQQAIKALARKFDMPHELIAEYGEPQTDHGESSMCVPVKYVDGTYDVLWCYKMCHHSLVRLRGEPKFETAFLGVTEMPTISFGSSRMHIRFTSANRKCRICIGFNDKDGDDYIVWDSPA